MGRLRRWWRRRAWTRRVIDEEALRLLQRPLTDAERKAMSAQFLADQKIITRREAMESIIAPMPGPIDPIRKWLEAALDDADNNEAEQVVNALLVRRDRELGFVPWSDRVVAEEKVRAKAFEPFPRHPRMFEHEPPNPDAAWEDRDLEGL